MESEFERLRKKVENYPSASAYNRLAELARLNGDSAEAERICQRCTKEFPRNGQAFVILGEIAMVAGRKDEALTHLSAAVERDARSYSGHRLLADLYSERGQTPKALHHLRQILHFKPNDAPVAQKIEQLTKSTGVANEATKANPILQPPTGSVERTLTPRSLAALSVKATGPVDRSAALAGLCAEHGVKGAVVSDLQGRVVVAQGLPDNKAELLAAFATEITSSSANALKTLGSDNVGSWIVEAELGSVLAFKREAQLTLAVLAAPGVRAALLELRARQALIDLGVA
ncbi:MAG: tetratricopeptide repeat protein [Planctomycetes bacterium]|nr:tetratricopeptide repeat protein [Planctomycetota bacterium]